MLFTLFFVQEQYPRPRTVPHCAHAIPAGFRFASLKVLIIQGAFFILSPFADGGIPLALESGS